MTTVAMLGTGIMGAAMARRMRARGMEVRAWNRHRERGEPLALDGISVVASPRVAAQGADVVVTMQSDAPAVEATMVGPEGALSALGREAVWLQTSTVGIEGCQRLMTLAGKARVDFLDAPVLGSKEPAEHGELLVLASGDRAVEPRVAPVLDAIARKTVWLGPAGLGSRAKLVANAWVTGLTGLIAETLALARTLGVDPRQFLELIQGGPLDSPYAQMKARAMLAGTFSPSFALRLAHKDVRLILEAAAGRPLPMLTALEQSFARAERDGHGDEDMAAIYAALGRGASTTPGEL
jgi:3-hydroxyisobutyrate dehydrogenase